MREMNDELKSYMNAMFNSLANNYRTHCGQYSESCSLIALKIASLLNNINCLAELYSVESSHNAMLTPARYSGHISWSKHIICVFEDYVYDPMASSEPMEVNDYLENAFDSKYIEMRLKLDKNTVSQRISYLQ